MGLFNLFKGDEIIAEIYLTTSGGQLKVSSQTPSNLTEDQYLTILLTKVIPTTFFLLDSPAARVVFYNLLNDIPKKDLSKYKQVKMVPVIENFQLNLLKNREGKPYIKETAISSLKLKNEIEYLTLMIFFLIFLYEKISDKTIVDSFLNEVTLNFDKIPLSAIQTYNYVVKISNRKFDEMGIDL